MPDKTEKQEGTSLEELFTELESVIRKMEGENISGGFLPVISQGNGCIEAVQRAHR